MQELLLGIREIYTCPICDKPCMDKNNLKANEENSVTYKSCLIKYHLACFPVNSEVGEFCEENDDTD